MVSNPESMPLPRKIGGVQWSSPCPRKEHKFTDRRAIGQNLTSVMPSVVNLRDVGLLRGGISTAAADGSADPSVAGSIAFVNYLSQIIFTLLWLILGNLVNVISCVGLRNLTQSQPWPSRMSRWRVGSKSYWKKMWLTYPMDKEPMLKMWASSLNPVDGWWMDDCRKIRPNWFHVLWPAGRGQCTEAIFEEGTCVNCFIVLQRAILFSGTICDNWRGKGYLFEVERTHVQASESIYHGENLESPARKGNHLWWQKQRCRLFVNTVTMDHFDDSTLAWMPSRERLVQEALLVILRGW